MKLPHFIYVLVAVMIIVFMIIPIFYSSVSEEAEVDSIVFSYHYNIRVTKCDSSVDTAKFTILGKPESVLYYASMESLYNSHAPVCEMRVLSWSEDMIEEYEEK